MLHIRKYWTRLWVVQEIAFALGEPSIKANGKKFMVSEAIGRYYHLPKSISKSGSIKLPRHGEARIGLKLSFLSTLKNYLRQVCAARSAQIGEEDLPSWVPDLSISVQQSIYSRQRNHTWRPGLGLPLRRFVGTMLG
jgi:hypothetical protein